MLKELFISIIKIYQRLFSPMLSSLFGSGGCRFVPTCSEYACITIDKYGIVKGVFLSLKRFLKCNSILNLPVDADLDTLKNI